MAETFSDIMKNYKDMSVAEIGTSLLQQKETRDKRAAKASRKNQRVQQALGLLLAGQSIFKGAYKKRAKELEDAYTFELANNKSQFQEINNASLLVQPLYEWSESAKANGITFKTEKEKLENFYSSPEFERFTVAINPYSEPAIKRGLGTKYDTLKSKNSYAIIQRELAKSYAEEYLRNDKYKTFVGTLKNLFGDQDGIELFKKGINLDHNELNAIERKNYETLLSQYNDRAGLLNGVKDVFARMGDKNKKEGYPNIFKRVTSADLAGAEISQVLDTMDLKGFTNQVVNRQLVAMNNSSTLWRDKLDLPENQRLKEYLPRQLEILNELVQSGDYPLYDERFWVTYGTRGSDKEKSDFAKTQYISMEDLDDLLDDIMTDASRSFERQALEEDGGALSLALNPLNGDQKLIRSIYESNHKGGDMTYDQYVNRLKDDSFRVQYGMVLAAKEGLSYVKAGRFLKPGGSLFERQSYYRPKGDVTELVYNRYKGPVPGMLGELINSPTVENRKYKVDDSWSQSSKEQQQIAFMGEYVKIRALPNVSETEKAAQLNNFFKNVPMPFDYSRQEFEESEEIKNFTQQAMGSPKVHSSFTNRSDMTAQEFFTDFFKGFAGRNRNA